jgi:hypothetical protein
MRKASTLVLAGLVAAIAALPAAAQTNPYNRTGPQPRESYGSYRAAPAYDRYSPRAINPYAAPRGYSGMIHWNTPNADGNLGGPGGGGSAGSPGG